MSMSGSEYTTSVIVMLPVREDSGELARESAIMNEETEVKIFSSFGKEGSYIEVCLYVMDPTTTQRSRPCIGDTFRVKIQGSGLGSIPWVISDIRFEEPDAPGKEWCLRITGEPPLYRALCHCTTWGMIDLGKSGNYMDAITEVAMKALKEADLYDENLEDFSVNCVLEGVDKVYEKMFCFNETVADMVDEIASELGLEYYYSPFEPSLFMGKPLASFEESDIEQFDELAPSGKYINYGLFDGGVVEIFDMVVQGGAMFLPGSMARIGGELWKAIKASYYANGENERENHVKMIRAAVTCDEILMACINDEVLPPDFPHVKDGVKVVDVKAGEGDARDSSHGKYEASFVPKDSSKQDQGAWKFLDNPKMGQLTRTTPYAGNGVGLLFPKVDGSRAMVFHPNTQRAFGLIGPMMWKEGDEKDTVPQCEDDDMLLRLDSGELYYDAAAEAWVLRAAKGVVIDTKDPMAEATSKPSNTPTGTAYIRIESGGTVTVEATTIKLGSGASKLVALADHTHTVTPPAGKGWDAVPGTEPAQVSASNSNSTKAKAE
jgi:hypothetical protein